MAEHAAWVVERGIDELRQAYAGLVLSLGRARAVTTGSRHPLPARALRRWDAALEQAGQVQRQLSGGVGELCRLSGVGPVGGVGEAVAALRRAADEVCASTASLVELRARIAATTAMESGEALPAAALTRLRTGAGELEELTARMQQGCVALSAYTDGVSGVDLMPGRTARAGALARVSWHPPDGVGVGAELAGRLVAAGGRRARPRRHTCGCRCGAGRPGARRAASGPPAGRGWPARTPTAPSSLCLRAVLLLTRGNTIWYADRLDLFRRAGALDGYVDALAAAVVVAVDRRLTRVGDGATVRRLAARIHDRYDGGTQEVPPEVAGALIRAALGVARPPAADPVRLILLQTLLLVDLLGDERLTRADQAAFARVVHRAAPG
ncbi:hypothetical protein ABNF97_12455 [Plantactinospora sp. B6F1]|uniref:hypothetical protein n=1 Tax=Plantactinospora sp. B6F1 TaxID=3158971 RepID=UPI00102BA95C